MLERFKRLKGKTLQTTDGEIGKVTDVYFEDQTWAIRYLVVRAGNWFSGEKVLISPIAVDDLEPTEDFVSVYLTKDQVKDSPSYDERKPVSREYEVPYFAYYGWPYYWGHGSLWGAGINPRDLRNSEAHRIPQPNELERSHNALRSSKEVSGYHIRSLDGEIGHITDFLFDVETWTIRYLVLDTRNWLPGKKVLLSPDWATRIDWPKQIVTFDLTQDQIQNAPEYNEYLIPSRDYEAKLHEHYTQQGYWETLPKNIPAQM